MPEIEAAKMLHHEQHKNSAGITDLCDTGDDVVQSAQELVLLHWQFKNVDK